MLLFGLLHVLSLLLLDLLLLLEVPLEVPLQEATQLRELGQRKGLVPSAVEALPSG